MSNHNQKLTIWRYLRTFSPAVKFQALNLFLRVDIPYLDVGPVGFLLLACIHLNHLLCHNLYFKIELHFVALIGPIFSLYAHICQVQP